MEENWVLQCYPRSGLGFKFRLQLNNTVGIIDSDYYNSDNEGHIFAKITNDTKEGKTVEIPAGTGFMQGIFMEYGITVDDDVEEVHFDMYEDDNRMVRLFINVGKKDKIKPANILGAIAGESGMPGKLVGAIDMLDNYTFVEVPAKHADKVLKAMSNAKIKGRSINIEKAQGGRKKKGRRK